jgi:uncharacterized protein (TIGR00730 family)
MVGIRSLCVFCGSSKGERTEYAEAARRVGREVAERGWTLVYGAGNIGLMGELADAALEAGGRVIGIIPESLVIWEVAHTGLTELRVVSTMHESKALMADLSDAFLALPGGYGTLDEFCEILTWAKLGLHRKPCGLLNVLGYYDALLALLDTGVRERFLRPEHRALLLDDRDDVPALLDRLAAFTPALLGKYIDRDDR